YPNTAFSSMDEADAAWMARILSHFDDATLTAVIDEAHLRDPLACSELERILKGRRDPIFERYLMRLSSLQWPELTDGRRLGVQDRREAAGLGAAPAPEAHLWLSARTASELPVSRGGSNELCVVLPAVADGQQVLLDLVTGRDGQFPLRLHLLGGEAPRVVGIERPEEPHPTAG